MTNVISQSGKRCGPLQHRRGTGRWKLALFDEFFADDFFNHTPQPGGTRDKAGMLVPISDCVKLFRISRRSFTDSALIAT